VDAIHILVYIILPLHTNPKTEFSLFSTLPYDLLYIVIMLRHISIISSDVKSFKVLIEITQRISYMDAYKILKGTMKKRKYTQV